MVNSPAIVIGSMCWNTEAPIAEAIVVRRGILVSPNIHISLIKEALKTLTFSFGKSHLRLGPDALHLRG
jgi:hypothetical protein